MDILPLHRAGEVNAGRIAIDLIWTGVSNKSQGVMGVGNIRHHTRTVPVDTVSAE